MYKVEYLSPFKKSVSSKNVTFIRFVEHAMTKEILTFPGIIFHEFGHKIFCNLTGVKVSKVCYFRFGNPCGYVVHEKPKTFLQSFLIAVGPLLSGTIFALLFFDFAQRTSLENWPSYLFIWLGFSVAINSFPSSGDARSLLKDSTGHLTTNLWAFLGYPAVLIIILADKLRVIWFDLLYAILLFYVAYKFL